jgi:hypothetical protein
MHPLEVSASAAIASRYLDFGDLALDAAIELEHHLAGQQVSFAAVGELADKLGQDGIFSDPTLLPVYDRALMNAVDGSIRTKNQLYLGLRERLNNLSASAGASGQALEDLRDFCLALHDALLNYRIAAQPIPMPDRIR